MSRLHGRGSRRRKEQIRRLVTLGAASRRRVGTLFVVEADLSEQRREHHSSRAWYCAGAQEDAMSKAQKPLKPDDFPVNAEGKKIKKQDGTPIANTTIRPSLPTLPNASTMTKPDAKKISGQPRYLLSGSAGVGEFHAAARSSLSAPRITIRSTSSGKGRCSALASSHGAHPLARESLPSPNILV